MPIIIKRRLSSLLLLLQPFAYAEDNTPVVIGVFSAYPGDVISHKISAFTGSVTRTFQRPVHVMTIDNADILRRLLRSQKRALVFLPTALLATDQPQLIPLVQTDVPLALYARLGRSDLADLKMVSIPESVSGAELITELARVNPAITVVREPIGVRQLRSLVAGTVDGAVMSVGLYDNLSPSLRNKYDQRYSFTHQQRILALCSKQFTDAERERLKALLLALPTDAREQLRRTFGVAGFEKLRDRDANAR
jgi:hypothetical protein